jgi:hypothetical protein
MVYPNGQVITFNYSGVDSDISRLTNIQRSGTTVEDIDYLGLATPIRLDHPGGIELTYIKQGTQPNGDAGDKYTGLDRFGRIVDQRWLDDGAAIDRFKYAYDRDGNRLYRHTTLNDDFDELYQRPAEPAGGVAARGADGYRRRRHSGHRSDSEPQPGVQHGRPGQLRQRQHQRHAGDTDAQCPERDYRCGQRQPHLR